jgi:release factor glutamine methyltransferase
MSTLDGFGEPTLVERLRAAGCVFAEEEAELLLAAAASNPAELVELVRRRLGGEPLEQVLGWAEFCGLRISVIPGVFVPRRRSELLVRQAVELTSQALPPDGPGPTVVDLCCGSGALAAAFAVAIRPARLIAVDVDPVAVECASRNLAPFGATVLPGDLFTPLPPDLRGKVDLLLANVPYVPTGEVGMLPAEARLYEPPVALDGGPDGLDVLRRVAGAAGGWLTLGGRLLTEVSAGQVDRACTVLAGNGLTPAVAYCAELEATVVIGWRQV